MRSCQHFRVVSELERARHKLFNQAIEKLNAKTLEEKLDNFFKNQHCAEKMNLVLESFKKYKWRIQIFLRTKNNTLLDQSKLVCIKDDLVKLEEIVSKTDVIQSCSREKTDKKRRFYKLTNSTVFLALLKDVPISWTDAVLRKLLPKNQTVNCLTFGKKTAT